MHRKTYLVSHLQTSLLQLELKRRLIYRLQQSWAESFMYFECRIYDNRRDLVFRHVRTPGEIRKYDY